MRSVAPTGQLVMRLLLVEDNERLAQLVVACLTKAGFDVDFSASVSGAQNALDTTRYAAVLLDLGLPDGDGRQIRRDLRLKGDCTPVLILTARGSAKPAIGNTIIATCHINGSSRARIPI